MVYVGERKGSSYKLNRVDLNNPTKKASRDIGGNVAVISASTGGGKIGIIQAEEIGYEAFEGAHTKIYKASDLSLLKTFPLAPPDAGNRVVEPLHHRDPSLAISDKYAVVATEDDGFFPAENEAQQYVSVYDLEGSKGASHTKAFAGDVGGARGDSVFGVGSLMGVAVNGDFILVGGNTGTAVYKIDSSGDSLAITRVVQPDGVGNHWFKDNGSYVLESKSNTGTVKVWKWNGSAAPTVVSESVDINGITKDGRGSIQALCFDPDKADLAYVYCKAARDGAAGRGGPVGPSPNAGDVYSLNLNSGVLTKLFNFETFNGKALTGLWTIEKQSSGSDTYYVFSGSYNADAGDVIGSVLVVKNPDSGETITDSSKVTEEQFTAPYNTAIRTLKTFKNSSGDVYFAAKNYTSGGTTWDSSSYKLVLKKLN
jgi:hypothetical protein